MLINTKVLMSGADYFNDGFAINALMDATNPVDLAKAKQEHDSIKHAMQSIGVEVIKVHPPRGCQDGVYTANWALCRGDTAVMASLPNKRTDEEDYAAEVLNKLGKRLVFLPKGLKFSGQGDALPCGDYLFAGTGYRTDREVHDLLAKNLDYKVISLQAIPTLDKQKKPVINKITGWPDSFFYDIDLAIAVLSPNLIAWCREAFTPKSQAKIDKLTDIEKIEVSYEEAVKGFACNLVSNGEAVVMSHYAPKLKKDIENAGFKTITIPATELFKGGGYIRCTTLTL
ncbi:MAG TPA: arginine deiminase-related protein [Candidatus Saccharibacteria bacterium]|nr:arginine deiminase-related protein [Candidatus Saccharibacteria bacterium]